jgi:hypothetical protein
MTAPIFSVAAADPVVKSLLGTNPVRIFPFGEAPEGTSKPYAVWQVVTGSPENYLAGRPDMDGFTLQVDVYGATGASVLKASEAIRNAIELQSYVTRWAEMPRDGETNNYRVSFDVDWFVPR